VGVSDGCLCWRRRLIALMGSEYHESTTGFPTWLHAYGQEETLPWYPSLHLTFYSANFEARCTQHLI
jgi:hypothetical protein